MNRMFIEPLDVLMFRSERPFTSRESHVAKVSIISPSIFDGAIKSKIFYDFCKNRGYSPTDFQRSKWENIKNFKKRICEKIKNDAELRRVLKVIGYPIMEGKPEILVRGVFFAIKQKYEEYFVMPNDIVKEDKDAYEKIKHGKSVNINPVKIEPKENINVNVNCGTPINVLVSKYLHVKKEEGFIHFNELKRYLEGEVPREKVNAPFLKETRIGIRLEKNRKKTIEGYIYTAEFYRLLRSWGFIAWFEGTLDFMPKKGLIKLGGEGRGASFERIDAKNLDFSDLIKEINEEGKFKLYLASPSLFNRGWHPPLQELKNLLGVEELKLVSSLPGKPVYIGGYNFALNMEKPLRKWINAGAVYYFKFKGNIREDVPNPIKILNDNIEMRCGFIGRW